VGLGELALTILREAQLDDSGPFANIDDATRYLSTLCRARWRDFFDDIPREQWSAVTITFVLAGYGKDGDPAVYALPSERAFVPFLSPRPYAVVGVSWYAAYLLHRYYHPEMSPSEVEELVEYAIAETALEDPRVGAPAQLVKVTPDGQFVELPRSDLQRIHEKNAMRDAQIRQLFSPSVASRPESPAR